MFFKAKAALQILLTWSLKSLKYNRIEKEEEHLGLEDEPAAQVCCVWIWNIRRASW